MRMSQRLSAALEGSLPGDRAPTVRVASRMEEYTDAFRIAYEAYFPLGFTAYSPSGMRITPYQFREGTVILVAYHAGEAVACLSLFEDGAEGLPSDAGWRTDLDRLRGARKKVFELGSLMVRPACPVRGPGICLALFRLAWLYTRSLKGADSLCAFVQKRHALFYKKMLTFTLFGEIRDYRWNGLAIPEVCPLAMDLEGAEAEFQRKYDHFGNSPRNLYRWFAVRGRKRHEDQLRRALRRRATLPMQELRRHFETLITSENPSSRPGSGSVSTSNNAPFSSICG